MPRRPGTKSHAHQRHLKVPLLAVRGGAVASTRVARASPGGGLRALLPAPNRRPTLRVPPPMTSPRSATDRARTALDGRVFVYVAAARARERGARQLARRRD